MLQSILFQTEYIWPNFRLSGHINRPWLSLPLGGASPGGCRCGWSSSSFSHRGGLSSPDTCLCLSTPIFLSWSSEVSWLGHLLSLSCSFSPLPLLFFSLLRISVEEQIGHHLPWHVSANRPPQSENLPSQHPPHQTKTIGTLVIARHSNVNKLGWRVNIAESHDRNISIGTLCD